VSVESAALLPAEFLIPLFKMAFFAGAYRVVVLAHFLR